MRIRRHLHIIASTMLFLAIVTAGVSSVRAQDYPQREIHLYVGFAAGSGADLLARYIGSKLSEKAGQPVLIENKPGASATIGAQAAALAKPDGYTLLLTGSSTHATAPSLFKKLPFDPVKDFTPITTVQKLAFVLMVDAKTPVNTVAELTEFLKKKGKTSYGVSNTTSLAAGEQYKTATGLDVLRVNYKATQEAVRDLYAGLIDFMFIDAGFAMQQARDGKMRALAVTSAERIAAAPDVPTLIESGFAGFELTPWWGMYGPAGLPQPIVGKLEGWLNEIIASEETKKFFASMGADPFVGNGRVLADFQVKEIEKWRQIFRAANVEPE